MRNTAFPIFLIFLLSLLTGACRHEQDAGDPPASPARTQVVAGHPSVQPMREFLTMNAVTTYTNRGNIRATTTGYVQKSAVKMGDQVKSGQEVFTLKTREAEALGQEILRDTSINITGIVSVVSKKGGIVTQVFFQEGDYVTEGDILAELTKPSSLAVKLYVPYEYSRQVQAQKWVNVRLPDGETLRGAIGQLLPSEDMVSQTTPYLATLSPYRFLPENLNVTVTVPLHFVDKALVAPPAALQCNEEQTEFWVMKLINDTLAIRQPATLGMRNDSLIELKNTGLTPSDRIIVQGAYGLPDTAAVTLVEQL